MSENIAAIDKIISEVSGKPTVTVKTSEFIALLLRVRELHQIAETMEMCRDKKEKSA